MKTLTLEEASVIELKAAVYDLQKNLARIQTQINILEGEIARREKTDESNKTA